MGGGLAETDCDSGADHWGGEPRTSGKSSTGGTAGAQPRGVCLECPRPQGCEEEREVWGGNTRITMGQPSTPGSPWLEYAKRRHPKIMPRAPQLWGPPREWRRMHRKEEETETAASWSPERALVPNAGSRRC